MPLQREDDLFRDSTMTFGQHLVELRACLIKSAMGLAVGVALGLFVGEWVVQFIQRPLSAALTRYYEESNTERMKAELEKLKGTNRALPWTPKEIEYLVKEAGLWSEKIYIDPGQMLLELKRAYPEQFQGIELLKKANPPPLTKADKPLTGDSDQAEAPAVDPKEGLIPLYFWHEGKNDPRVQIKTFNAQEGFSVYLKASILVGILLASPWIFYQIWQFVAAGLYPHERHYVQLYGPFSLVLFFAGAGLAFFLVFEPVLNFLFSFNRSLGIDPDPRMNEWLGFVLWLPVGFGIGFQLPLVMLFLERIGIFTVENYLKQWRVAVLVIFVAAAILTPPDPYSMLLLATPLTFLFFVGVLLCKLTPRKTRSVGP